MKPGRMSQTALKVGLAMITLSVKDDWAGRLPPGLVDLTERLILASGAFGYGPRTIRASKRPWMLSIYRLQELMLPGQFEGFGHRKIYIQEQVEAAIAAGARQVLVVGAGFDTLCLRLAPQHPDVLFVEVDHPATAAAKARGIAQEGQPTNMTQIPVDLGEHALSQVLSAHERWQPAVPSVVVAEGLLQYLTDEQVRSLLTEAARCTAPGSRFVFTHAIPADRPMTMFLTRLVGEPWQSAVRSEDLPQYIEGTGWTRISDVDTNAEHGAERYAVVQRH